MSEIGSQLGYPITCIGVPKTVDNDLPITDCCPGFGSVAKYVAVSTREAALDVRVHGAHLDQGLRARGHGPARRLDRRGRRACGQAERAMRRTSSCSPKSPSIAQKFLAKVKPSVDDYGYCVIVVSEGVRDADGQVPRRGRHAAMLSAMPSWAASDRLSRR